MQATLTDAVRPAQAMERLRARFPHALALRFAPGGGEAAAVATVRDRRGPPTTSRSTSCAHVRGAAPPADAESELLRDGARVLLRGPRPRRRRDAVVSG